MPQQPSQTGIVNAALALLASTQTLTSIDGGTATARAARIAWDVELRELMSDHPWNFAIRRTQLNASADAPEFGFARAFPLPADCFRWLPPNQDDDEGDWFVGVEEGGAILTDAEAPLRVRYISTDPLDDWQRWPAHFVRAMTYRMAAALAEPITASESRADKMAARAQRVVARAKRIDAFASGNRSRVNVSSRSNWIDARQRPYHPYGTR